ncbi:gluconokinase [Arthrobacter sp. fls2-241-R2A-200]|uniref:gluconokinase n=1 Tax=Arthrobacter sp. fls2-241-R2A-200 TaxID=3040281 RepID=UPI0025506DB1|nr:gluconokinase [Arthrobacter sp. fls2-241-R2A-200]
MKPVIVIMGVCGAGKSTVGAALAQRLGAKFVDSDSLHPRANVHKMTQGIPLTDEDRWPWLTLVGDELAAPHPDGIVVACSALKRAYRDAIRDTAPATTFIQLDVERSLLEERLTDRPGHFMPATLLQSQLETLEPLDTNEAGVRVPPAQDIDASVDTIFGQLHALHEVSQNP